MIGLPIGADASPGDEKWKLPLDGPVCGYTRHVTGDHRTAVLYRANDRGGAYCNHVAFFDLDDGREVWDTDFPYSKSGDAEGLATGGDDQDTPSVTLTHGTVVVTWGGGTDAYSMDTGRRLWRTTSTGSRQDMGAAGGGALLIRQECWHDDAPLGSTDATTYKARKVDPGTAGSCGPTPPRRASVTSTSRPPTRPSWPSRPARSASPRCSPSEPGAGPAP